MRQVDKVGGAVDTGYHHTTSWNNTTEAAHLQDDPRHTEKLVAKLVSTRPLAPSEALVTRRRPGTHTSASPVPSAVEPTAGGVLLSIRVIPRAGTSAVAGLRAGALLVRLKAAPVEGAANDELVGLIARLLGVPKRNVAIVSGARGRQKQLRVSGVDAPSAAPRLLGQAD